MKATIMNTIGLYPKHIPTGWMEDLVANQKIGGVMLVFVEGKDKEEIEYKTKQIEEFCKTLKKGVKYENNESVGQKI